MATYSLNTKMIPRNHKIWIVYSGHRRRYFRKFLEDGCVFLQTPGFSAFDNTFKNVASVRQHLRMSDEIGNFIKGSRQTPPSRRPDAYSSDPGSGTDAVGKAFNHEVGNILRLFSEAKRGDLVISPNIGHFEKMLIGEISSEWTSKQVTEVPQLANEVVPIREVSWIRADLARRDFPTLVARTLQNPHAVSEYDSAYYEDVYKTVYRRFIWGDHSKVDFSAGSYSSHDPLETYEGAFLIKYLVAAFFALDNGHIDDFRKLPEDQAVSRYYRKELVIEFQQNFNSPGKFVLVSSGPLLAIMIALGVQIAVDARPLTDILNNFSVVAGNANPGDGTTKEVKEGVEALINGIGRDRFEKIIKEKYGSAARQKINMTPGMDE